MDTKMREERMEKTEFLTKVSEVMKSMVTYEAMMESLRRSCLRSEAENLELLERERENVDRLIEESNGSDDIVAPEDTFDALILRYLKNTQFLSTIEEDYIDISNLENDLAFWKKTLLYNPPSI